MLERLVAVEVVLALEGGDPASLQVIDQQTDRGIVRRDLWQTTPSRSATISPIASAIATAAVAIGIAPSVPVSIPVSVAPTATATAAAFRSTRPSVAVGNRPTPARDRLAKQFDFIV
jgi:hypothetical protein